MDDLPVSARTTGMGDTALRAATGKSWQQWFRLLDAAGATAWTHPQIVVWLTETHGVGAWWAQGVTIGFEQERGMRVPGQRADGTFEVSASRAVAGEQEEALEAVIVVVSAELGKPASVSTTAKYATARWKLEGRESVLATADPAKSGKTRVSLSQQRMTTHAQMTPAKERLAAWLVRATESQTAD